MKVELFFKNFCLSLSQTFHVPNELVGKLMNLLNEAYDQLSNFSQGVILHNLITLYLGQPTRSLHSSSEKRNLLKFLC